MSFTTIFRKTKLKPSYETILLARSVIARVLPFNECAKCSKPGIRILAGSTGATHRSSERVVAGSK
jgi:hypothetical protein